MNRVKKGQALTELAIFGTILLFCVGMLLQYGLEANYQQQVQMEAFRKAQKVAFYKTGPNSSTSLVLIKDKPLPDPRDQFGFAERAPIGSSANVVWDTNLSAEYVKRFDRTPEAEDLPAMYFEIDRARTIPREAGANVPGAAQENNVFGFYTARFEKRACPGSITVVSPNINPVRTRDYIEEPILCDSIRVMRIEDGEAMAGLSELMMYPYYLKDGFKRRISEADIDGDRKLEYVIGANSAKVLYYVNYHSTQLTATAPAMNVAGAIQIESDYVNLPSWDAAMPEQRQGLIGDFVKTIQHRGSSINIVKQENRDSPTSRTNLNVQQTLTHRIRLNNGRVLEIPANFTVNSGNLYNWEEPAR